MDFSQSVLMLLLTTFEKKVLFYSSVPVSLDRVTVTPAYTTQECWTWVATWN